MELPGEMAMVEARARHLGPAVRFPPEMKKSRNASLYQTFGAVRQRRRPLAPGVPRERFSKYRKQGFRRSMTPKSWVNATRGPMPPRFSSVTVADTTGP